MVLVPVGRWPLHPGLLWHGYSAANEAFSCLISRQGIFPIPLLLEHSQTQPFSPSAWPHAGGLHLVRHRPHPECIPQHGVGGVEDNEPVEQSGCL